MLTNLKLKDKEKAVLAAPPNPRKRSLQTQDKSTPSLVISSTDEGIQHDDELHDEECPCPKCKLYRWRMETHSEPGTEPVCEGDDCQGCAFCLDVPLSAIFARFEPVNQYNGVQPEDLGKHTSLCLDRSWTVYKQSALDQHICICDGRGNGMEWDELDRERRLVGQQEVEVRQERITREREKWQSYDTPGETETKAESSLDDLTAVFDDEIDLTPTPSILDRKHGDGGLVIPAGKLNWIYGLPSGGKSFVGLIAVSEAVLRGGRVMYLDYEDYQNTFHQRAAILGLKPNDHADSFRYIHGGLADFPLATAQAKEWLEKGNYSFNFARAIIMKGYPLRFSPALSNHQLLEGQIINVFEGVNGFGFLGS